MLSCFELQIEAEVDAQIADGPDKVRRGDLAERERVQIKLLRYHVRRGVLVALLRILDDGAGVFGLSLLHDGEVDDELAFGVAVNLERSAVVEVTHEEAVGSNRKFLLQRQGFSLDEPLILVHNLVHDDLRCVVGLHARDLAVLLDRRTDVGLGQAPQHIDVHQ